LRARDTCAAAYYARARETSSTPAGHAVIVYCLNVLATRTLM
jgi:hypothetical protein